MKNLQEQVKKAFFYQKLFWPFTVWINCSINLNNFANSWPSASNFKSFSRSQEQFFLTVGQNNFGNKIPFLKHMPTPLDKSASPVIEQLVRLSRILWSMQSGFSLYSLPSKSRVKIFVIVCEMWTFQNHMPEPLGKSAWPIIEQQAVHYLMIYGVCFVTVA